MMSCRFRLDTNPKLRFLCFFSSQTGGGGGGSVHTYQAHAGGGAEEGSRGRDGPARGSTGHFPIHGSRPAEVPEDHQAAALPQYGEHPAAPGLLHHQQHDTQGQSTRRSHSL